MPHFKHPDGRKSIKLERITDRGPTQPRQSCPRDCVLPSLRVWFLTTRRSNCASMKMRVARRTGSAGGRIFRSGNGARCARIIRRMAMPGIHFPHDHARSRAYRWGEDGLLGICDRECRLCFALALWNGRDPILKERLFGLTESAGQSRRGREGVVLVSRLDADAFLHARRSTSIRRRSFPTRGWSRRMRGARGTSASSKSTTPASSTSTATSMSSPNTRRRRRRIC